MKRRINPDFIADVICVVLVIIAFAIAVTVSVKGGL